MRGSGLMAIAVATASIAVVGSQAVAQSFRVGDRVEASPSMMESNWESCVVTSLHPGGDVGVACGPRGTQYVTQSRWVRHAARAAPDPRSSAPVAPQSRTRASVSGGSCANAARGLVGNRPQENGVCRIGARVRDREGRVGTVYDAPSPTMCRVCLSDGTPNTYLTWMLSAAGSGSPAHGRQGTSGGAAPSGNYQCYGGAAGNMRITIRGGRWNDFYAETLPDGRVGISSRPNGRPYYMVCERR